MPGNARVQTKIGVSRRASRSSRSIARFLSAYSSGNAVSTEEVSANRKSSERLPTDAEKHFINRVILKESETGEVLTTDWTTR